MAFGAELNDFVKAFSAGSDIMDKRRQRKYDEDKDKYLQAQTRAVDESITDSQYKRAAPQRAVDDFSSFMKGNGYGGGDGLSDPAPTEAVPTGTGGQLGGERDTSQDGVDASALQAADTSAPRASTKVSYKDPTVPDAVKYVAEQTGANPIDVATVFSYETGGTFNPSIMGGKNGKYGGLIQAGPDERKQYGIDTGQSAIEQAPGIVAYLKDRGYKPGMDIRDLYSTINAGRPGHYNASDGPGQTVNSHVQAMMGDHRAKALAMMSAVDNGSGGGTANRSVLPTPDASGFAGPDKGIDPSLQPGSGGDDGLPPVADYAPDIDSPAMGGKGALPTGGDREVAPPIGQAEGDDRKNPISVGLKAVRDALHHGAETLGLTKKSAVADPSETQAAQKYISGYGSAPPSLVQQAESIVDPKGTMSESERKLRALGAVSDYYREKGDPKAADEATYSMIQYYRQVSQKYAAFAQVAAQNGDMDGAAVAAMKSYANIPDGKDLKIVKTDTGGYQFTFTDQKTGKTMQQGILTPQQMGAMAMKVSPANFDQFIMSSGVGGTTRRGNGTGGAKAPGALDTPDNHTDAYAGAMHAFQGLDPSKDAPPPMNHDAMVKMTPREAIQYEKDYRSYVTDYNKANPKAKAATPLKTPSMGDVAKDQSVIDQGFSDATEQFNTENPNSKIDDTNPHIDDLKTAATDVAANEANRKKLISARDASKFVLSMTKMDSDAPLDPKNAPYKSEPIKDDPDNVKVTLMNKGKPGRSFVMSSEQFKNLDDPWQTAAHTLALQNAEKKKKDETSGTLAGNVGKAAAAAGSQLITGAKRTGEDIAAGARAVAGQVQQAAPKARDSFNQSMGAIGDAGRSAVRAGNAVGDSIHSFGDQLKGAVGMTPPPPNPPIPQALPVDRGVAPAPGGADAQMLLGMAAREVARGQYTPQQIASKLNQARIPPNLWPPALLHALAGTTPQ